MRFFLMMGVMLLLNGCAGLDNRPARVYKPIQPARSVKPILPQLPEIKAPVAVKPYRYQRARLLKPTPIAKAKQKAKAKTKVKPRYKIKAKPRYQVKAKPRYQVKPRPKPKYKAPIVGRYPSSSATMREAKMIDQELEHSAIAVAPKQAEVDIDPYANIPENADDRGAKHSRSSPAVEALLVRAYADAKLGRTNAAMVKLERGLRMEPQNPKLWNQLAELHYKKGDYRQAITMAKKAISLSANDEEMTNKNWQFISKVAEKSGNSQAMSEVNEYNKRH